MEQSAFALAARAQLKRPATWIFALLFIAGSYAFFVGRGSGGKATARLSADARYYYVYLPSLLLDHDLDFTNEYKLFGNYYKIEKSPIGRPGNPFGIGPALYHAPFFLVGHGIAQLTDSDHRGASPWEERTTMYGSFVFAFLALIVLYRVIRRLYDETSALMAAVGIVVAGPLLWYGVRQPGYSHPPATLAIALMVLVWMRETKLSTAGVFERDPGQRSFRVWAILGALLGCAMLARPQQATWASLIVWDAVLLAWPHLRARRVREFALALRGPALAALATIVLFLPQLIAWKAIYGSAFTVPQGGGFMRWDTSNWSETLFSSRNGLFPTTPIMAIGALGLGLFFRKHRSMALPLVLAVVLQVWINGAAWDWWAGGAFGGRRYDGTTVVFALGLAAVVAYVRGAIEAYPSRAAALFAGALVLFFALPNALRVSHLDAWSVTQSAHSMRGNYSREWGRVEEAVYDKVGNIFSFPASTVFGLKYGVPASRYDEVVGSYFLNDEFVNEARENYKRRDALLFAAGGHQRFLISGFGAAAGGSRPLAAKEARAFVPINQPGGLLLRLRGSAPPNTKVALKWPGGAVSESQVDVTGRIDVVLKVAASDVNRGINVLVISTSAPDVTRVETVEIEPN